MDKVRPAGALLKVFGGRASGPEPLEDLFRFTVDTFKDAAGRKLNSLQCHDIMCKIGDVVVVGGVRRSALISLSNLSDLRMRNAKAGEWYKANPQRALANNSVCYTEKPDNIGVFMEEWLALYMSKNGERGIFNRQAAKDHVRKIGRRDPDHEFGTNPCSEIILRPNQFCNLTEVVCRPSDTKETLMDKIKAATILGTIQSTLTNFKYLRKIWTKNTEEERLLGVSLTGILDCPLLTEENPNLEELLNDLRDYAVEVNREYADLLGINPSAAITCVKPSGTVSQLVNSASGIHARHSPYYIRTVRSDIKDPLTTFMINAGFPNEVDLSNSQNVIFSFPVVAPENAICRTDKTALQQLRFWKIYATTWCEHKPSITVSIKEHEWLEVGAWLHKNFHYLSGIAFLNNDDHVYQQAPYTDINEQQYKEMLMTMPKDIDWTGLSTYEKEDNTVASQELACAGGVCEIL
jgi:ribonucleoside-diphosphate reductase alpha chain